MRDKNSLSRKRNQVTLDLEELNRIIGSKGLGGDDVGDWLEGDRVYRPGGVNTGTSAKKKTSSSKNAQKLAASKKKSKGKKVYRPGSVGGPAGDVMRPVEVCHGCGQPVDDPDVHPMPVEDGRYEGGSRNMALETRVDLDGSHVISGDVFAINMGQEDYLASFRTAPGLDLDTDAQPFEAIYESKDGTVVMGDMEIAPMDAEGTVAVTLYVDGSVPGIPQRTDVVMTADWVSPHLRVLGIELEKETDTEDPPAYETDAGEIVTFASCMRDAGFELRDVGDQTRIPKEEGGWGTAQLHSLMYDWAKSRSDLDHPQWRQQLLWLGTPARPGLLGVMFDTSAELPRQGTAVFDTEIRNRVPFETERKIIQTAAHEVGHGLNLAHRFEREVGHADSNSIMNYDWKYKGGNRTREFWEEFNFSFDPDELEFLRHAPRNKVIPGGAPFHSVAYWKNGSGSYVPYVPEQSLDILDLTISPPKDVNIIAFGQPLFIEVALHNRGTQPIPYDKRLLDPKGSFLQIQVRKKNADASMQHFHPILERCMDIQADTLGTLKPNGDPVTDNIQINFGAGGFAFPEPGAYEIQAFGSIIINRNDLDRSNDRELIVASNTLEIFVSYPRSRQEEQNVVDVLHNPEVGVYFALGGSKSLGKAADLLKKIEEERMKGKDEVDDPIVANIIRCQGIDLGRRYRRFENGRFRAKDGNAKEAIKQLKKLKSIARTAFDASTCAGTEGLINRHQKRLKK